MTVNDISPENKKLFVDATQARLRAVRAHHRQGLLNLAIKELN